MFIHDALNEFILYGQTEIPAADLRKVIGQLNLQHDPCSAVTEFEHQFQVRIINFSYSIFSYQACM